MPFWARKRERAPEDGAAALPWSCRIAVKGCRMKFARWAGGIILCMPLAATAAPAPQQSQSSQTAQGQAQSSSVADAARAARETKKDQQKPPRVWTNDNIPTAPGTLNVVGESPSTGSDSDHHDNKESKEDKAALENDVASAKDKLQSLQTDLNILQRTRVLDSDMYYGKPDFQNDTAGAQKLKDEQAAIDTKQQEIEDEQQKIADLQNRIAAAEAAAKSSDSNANSPAPAPAAPASDNGNSGNSGGSSSDQSASGPAPTSN